MALINILVALAFISLASASEIHLNVVPPPVGVKLPPPLEVSHPVVEADVKVQAPAVPVPEVKKVEPIPAPMEVVQKAKTSLDSQEGVVKLYRHDMGAGIYRTETGELVRMYRVERAKKMRSAPAAMMRREGMMGNEGPRARLFGLGGSDWLGNWGYSGYSGYSPYNSAYSYNYLGGGGYPYSYSPYSYSGYSPYYSLY